MTGANAAWNIAFGEAPRGVPYRGCVTTDCLCPVHLRLARDRRAMWDALAQGGRLKGRSVEQKRRAAHAGQRAQGIVLTDVAVVRAIKAAPESATNVELAQQHGILHQTVSAIRLGKTYRWVEA
jgi:hypothetical protein